MQRGYAGTPGFEILTKTVFLFLCFLKILFNEKYNIHKKVKNLHFIKIMQQIMDFI